MLSEIQQALDAMPAEVSRRMKVEEKLVLPIRYVFLSEMGLYNIEDRYKVSDIDVNRTWSYEEFRKENEAHMRKEFWLIGGMDELLLTRIQLYSRKTTVRLIAKNYISAVSHAGRSEHEVIYGQVGESEVDKFWKELLKKCEKYIRVYQGA